MIDFPDARTAARQIAAVSEQTRLQILYILAEGPHHVGQLAELLGVPIVNMSHHLGVLRQHGLVEDEKEGRRVVYKFHPDVFTPPNGDADSLGTITLGVCRLAMRRSDALTADGERVGKKSGRKKAD
jgi:DNA-binding transcriptional ArsR family regulator